MTKINETRISRPRLHVIQVEDEYGSVVDFVEWEGDPEKGIEHAQREYQKMGLGAKRITAIPSYRGKK